MIRVVCQDQTVLSGDGAIGNCFSACVATIIGRKTEGVPHFALLGNAHAMETAVAWLYSLGYNVGTRPDDYAEDGYAPMPMHIMKGFSPRNIYHAVVGDTVTGEMIHDPHPSRDGINSVNSRLYLFKTRDIS